MYNTAKEKYLELMDNFIETMKSLEELMDSDEFIEWYSDSEDEDRPQYTNMTMLIEALEDMKEDLLEREEHNKQIQEALNEMVSTGDVVMSVDDNGEILYSIAPATEK